MKTLKEKMNVIHYYKLSNNRKMPVHMHDDQIEGCVQVARYFAVGFAGFCFKYDRKNPKHTLSFIELLEIYENKKQ